MPIVVAVAVLAGCGGDTLPTDAEGCSIVPFTSGKPAGGAQRAATIFERFCPGSRRSTWNVSIQPRIEIPKGEGNVFIAEDSGGVIAASGDRFIVVANWLDSLRLQIGYDERARVIKSTPVFGGVRIELRPISRKPE